jgi:hypothetical protein
MNTPGLYAYARPCTNHGTYDCYCEEYYRVEGTPEEKWFRVNDDCTVDLLTEEEVYGKEYLAQQRSKAEQKLRAI